MNQIQNEGLMVGPKAEIISSYIFNSSTISFDKDTKSKLKVKLGAIYPEVEYAFILHVGGYHLT